MGKVNCPQCGAKITPIDHLEKIIICKYCASSIFVENIGTSSESLIQLKQQLRLRGKTYTPLTCEQYKYDEGIRAEWLLRDEQNKLFSLTQDDENYSLVANCDCPIDPSLSWHSLMPNSQVSIGDEDWLVTEKRLFANSTNQQLMYSYLTGQNAELMVLIFAGKSIQCRRGFWLDPFEISDEN
ncbi:MAG: hypothetical protein JKY19_10940 [Alcanivoracaceae bacterium]|nr:hypothetical protein [Alcanivoracaceae bacterium]